MKDEYIKRDTAYNYLTEFYNHRTNIQHQNLRKALYVIPSEDVVEVRHGEWVEKETFNDENADVISEWQSARCSVCNKYHTTPYLYCFTDYNFCPNCGADMRGGT